MTERRLLIGFTPTPAGHDAVELGRLMADVTDASPVVAEVLHWPRHLMSVADLERALEHDTKDDFDAIRDRLAGLDPVFEAIADHSPAGVLQELARRHRAEMLVIGSAHRGRIGRTLAGTTGHSLLHGSPCPVVVAPRGFAEKASAKLGRIGVAFDGSPPAWAALETGIGLAERVHGSLEVIVVAEPPAYGYTEALGVLSGEGLHTAEESEKHRLLDLALGRVPQDMPVEGKRITGNAGRVLADVSHDLDLLLCGSRAYGPIRQTALGSTSRVVIDSAHCPVVILPRGKGLDPLRLGEQKREPVGWGADRA